ncbi:hypothetical protein JR316_0010253 [Psilocybe cubensis]|uniref:Uncharacterized protein n=2 Tax=Psilocybe cubensis TaxID=181762 RepID=A0A8H7XRU1_PSICU|nr:hypothetical protein JR316_0010253 [Psilocybe cubensis]KAH9478018.1 hypothetical protein JR316_0010253 [Psilocybe cubensis]
MPPASLRKAPPSAPSDSDDGESDPKESKDQHQIDPERIQALNKALDSQGKTKQSAHVASFCLYSQGSLNFRAILKPYTSFARWHTRSKNLYENWYEVLDRGISYYIDSFGDTDIKNFENQYRNELIVFADMIAGIKCFESDLFYFISPKNVDRKDDLAKAMIAASGAARSEDISTLQNTIITYINECSPANKVEISATSTKSESRGFKNKVLARLLCPMKYLKDFDDNPTEFMCKLDKDVIHVLAKDLPTFLWESDKFDPEDWDSEMFRTRLIVMVWKHIFTSPSSALKDKPGQTKTRSSQAKIHHMKTVTPASIAYACLLIRYSISSIEDWRIEDNVFDRHEFYKYIISLFEPDKKDDGDSEWSMDTIEWWNAKVLNKDPRSAKTKDNLDGPSTYDTIAEQRRARKARKAQAAASTTEGGGKEAGGSGQGKGGRSVGLGQAGTSSKDSKKVVPHLAVPAQLSHHTLQPVPPSRHHSSPRQHVQSPRRHDATLRGRSPRHYFHDTPRGQSPRRHQSRPQQRTPSSQHYSESKGQPQSYHHSPSRRQSPSRRSPPSHQPRTAMYHQPSSPHPRYASPRFEARARQQSLSRHRSHSLSPDGTLDVEQYTPEKDVPHISSQTLREANSEYSSPPAAKLPNLTYRPSAKVLGKRSQAPAVSDNEWENSGRPTQKARSACGTQSSPSRALVFSESYHNRGSGWSA